MRRLLASLAVVSLVGCSGGGSSTIPPATGGSPGPSSTPTPAPAPTATPASGFASPTFHIVVPAAHAITGIAHPQYVSPSTASISIQLTSDSAGIDPATLTGNPAVTAIDSSNCSAGCTVSGPPSPLGSDTFILTTTDELGATLSRATATLTIAEGSDNEESVTLNGVVKSVTIATSLSATAGTAASAPVTLSGYDADGNLISGTYSNHISIDPQDPNGDGFSVTTGSCPGSYPSGNPAVSINSINVSSSATAVTVCYGGVAEESAQLSATVGGGTHGTYNIPIALNAPVYIAGSGSPSSVAVDSDSNGLPAVDLFAESGTGSTGNLLFTETGWTDAPYNQQLRVDTGTCSSGGSLGTFAGIGVTGAGGSTGTTVSATAVIGAVAGLCQEIVSDGLSGNPTQGTAKLDVSYTSSSFGVNATRPKRK